MMFIYTIHPTSFDYEINVDEQMFHSFYKIEAIIIMIDVMVSLINTVI